MHIYLSDRKNRDNQTTISPWTYKGDSTIDHYKDFAIFHMDNIKVNLIQIEIKKLYSMFIIMQITTLIIHSNDDPFISVNESQWYINFY